MSGQLPTPDDLEWERRVRDLEKTELDRLQAGAEQWRNGLTSLASLVAVATAASAPFVGEKLEGGARFWLAVTTGVALALLIGGAAKGMAAAFGYPTKTLNTGAALKKWTEERIETTLSSLQWARRLTVGGVIMLVASAGVAYFGAEPTEAEDTGVINLKSGTTICGSVTWADSKVMVTSPEGTVTTHALEETESIDYPKDCP